MRKYDCPDIYRFIESLKHRPETYKTILLDKFDNRTTETTKVRKKISRFVRQDFIASGLLDGESGVKIFYSVEKNYFIVILRKDKKFFHYYCSNIDDLKKGKDQIVLYNAFILHEYEWDYLGNISVDKKDIHRWW